jgi:hypothetical protein
MPALPQSVFVTNTQVQELLKVGYSKLIVKTYNGVLTIASISTRIMNNSLEWLLYVSHRIQHDGAASLLPGTWACRT